MSGTFDQAFPNPPINPDDPGLAPEDVRYGVKYSWGDAEYAGILLLPTEDQVLWSVLYGADDEYSGTLIDSSGTGVSEILPPVRPDGQIRSPLMIRNSFTGSRAFRWRVPKHEVTPNEIQLRFYKLVDSVPTWYISVTCSYTVDGDYWDIVGEMSSDLSYLAKAGENTWKLFSFSGEIYEDGTEYFLLGTGDVTWTN